MSEQDSNIVKIMQEEGSPFIRTLANLYTLADKYNRQLIKANWHEYWRTYEIISRKRQEAICEF